MFPASGRTWSWPNLEIPLLFCLWSSWEGARARSPLCLPELRGAGSISCQPRAFGGGWESLGHSSSDSVALSGFKKEKLSKVCDFCFLFLATLTYDTLRFEYEDFPETKEPVWILGRKYSVFTGILCAQDNVLRLQRCCTWVLAAMLLSVWPFPWTLEYFCAEIYHVEVVGICHEGRMGEAGSRGMVCCFMICLCQGFFGLITAILSGTVRSSTALFLSQSLPLWACRL